MADISIASRASNLAMKQAEIVRDLLPNGAMIQTYKTEGDRILDRPLQDIGGKGLFTKEIDGAVLSGKARMAVHSVKDMETELPQNLHIGAVLEREDCRDALVSAEYSNLAELPQGAVVGTSSLRRRAQILNKYPHLKVADMRGNVETRLRKLKEGDYAALILAVAGLRRLGLEKEISTVLSTEDMLPAVGQGALAVVCRQDDAEVVALLEALNHAESFMAVMAERHFLRCLDGSCRTPIAALAEVRGDKIHLQGLLAEEGGRVVRGACEAEVKVAKQVAEATAEALRRQFSDGHDGTG